ncbi:LacI family DNA-binding transcriptional regulator [Microterricola pindariensis]|uniref:LacI family transcriptional regulator n=1 Tax=Microterricola pindariensis TaxID=478010 RepID=A0ABX5AVM3_9MICO|nr:LacI family DNA-binding transcriptional regulator [Microterricola pindariensis]PPL17631.1 LacI family transcriptional regulator [Microterricola pindariensis]
MMDVALRAGVSHGTVSNFFNRPQLLSEATREKVAQAVADLAFVPNDAARTLAKGTGNTIGVVLVDIGNSFFVDIARGVESAAAESAHKLLLANSDVNAQKQDDYLELFDETRVRGIILAPLDGEQDGAARVRSHGRPVVFVNWPGEDDASCGVIVDEEHGGYLAARHLIELGRTTLLFAGGPLTLHAVADRLNGVRRAIDEAPGVALEVLETHSLTTRAGRVLGHELAIRPPARQPDGVVCAADSLAIGCIEQLVGAGIRVPEDIAVTGYDNNHYGAESAVPVTTIAQPGHEMGVIAAELLAEEVGGLPGHTHRTVILKPSLLVRKSTVASAVPAITDAPETAR